MANSLGTNADRDRELQSLVGSLASGLSGGPSGLPAGLNSLQTNQGDSLSNLAQSSPNSGLETASTEQMNIQGSSPQHEEGAVQSESPSLNIGGLQDGGSYSEEGHNNGGEQEPQQQQESAQGAPNMGNDFRRSKVPAHEHASFYEDDEDEVDDIDNSMERDTKSTIPHEADDDLLDDDVHERVHKDIIPRPEYFL